MGNATLYERTFSLSTICTQYYFANQNHLSTTGVAVPKTASRETSSVLELVVLNRRINPKRSTFQFPTFPTMTSPPTKKSSISSSITSIPKNPQSPITSIPDLLNPLNPLNPLPPQMAESQIPSLPFPPQMAESQEAEDSNKKTQDEEIEEGPNGERTDPTIFATSFKKNRFFLFSRRSPEDNRDVFNEKPTKEDQQLAVAIK